MKQVKIRSLPGTMPSLTSIAPCSLMWHKYKFNIFWENDKVLNDISPRWRMYFYANDQQMEFKHFRR